jgi:hypothetical protein
MAPGGWREAKLGTGHFATYHEPRLSRLPLLPPAAPAPRPAFFAFALSTPVPVSWSCMLSPISAPAAAAGPSPPPNLARGHRPSAHHPAGTSPGRRAPPGKAKKQTQHTAPRQTAEAGRLRLLFRSVQSHAPIRLQAKNHSRAARGAMRERLNVLRVWRVDSRDLPAQGASAVFTKPSQNI